MFHDVLNWQKVECHIFIRILDITGGIYFTQMLIKTFCVISPLHKHTMNRLWSKRGGQRPYGYDSWRSTKAHAQEEKRMHMNTFAGPAEKSFQYSREQLPSNRPLHHFLEHPENPETQSCLKNCPKNCPKISKKNVFSKASWKDLNQPLPRQTTQPSPGKSIKCFQRISSKCPTYPQQTHNAFLKNKLPI